MWQLEVAEKLFELEEKGGVLILRAGTGSGKTEASVLPGLFLGRQVIIVEPYRALIEDMVERFKKYLANLSGILNTRYMLGVDYGGRHYVYEFVNGDCRRDVKGECMELPTKKPFGADVLVTTIDEMVYRILSVGIPRKASLYTSLVRTSRPIVFFDEAHSYTSEAFNPMVTLVHLVVSLSMYTPVVLATATIPVSVEEHLMNILKINGINIIKLIAPAMEGKPQKAGVKLDLNTFGNRGELVNALINHVENYVKRGFRKILVRVVEPETAYDVYTRLLMNVSKEYCVGVLHGRMPIYDREKVFKSIRNDVNSDEKVILVSTSVIEAGVDLDFDAGVIELTPYRSLEQTMGRVNRRYTKKSEVTIVNTLDDTWMILEEPDYLVEVRELLKKISTFSELLAKLGGEIEWNIDLSPKLREIDEKYTKRKLSASNLVDAYGSPYSRILAASLYSLFHLEGSFLEHLLALSKAEYEVRGILDIEVEVEGEPGNVLRIPPSVAKILEKHGINITIEKTLPKNILVDHSYIRKTQKIEARGLILKDKNSTHNKQPRNQS